MDVTSGRLEALTAWVNFSPQRKLARVHLLGHIPLPPTTARLPGEGLWSMAGGMISPYTTQSQSACAGCICSVDQCRPSGQCAAIRIRMSGSSGRPTWAPESGGIRPVREKAVRDHHPQQVPRAGREPAQGKHLP
jgi:hypothetical protein